MNTTFFEKASNLSRDFKWKDIFSDVFKPHTREERSRLLSRGIGNHIPAPAHMLQQWQKPWLFVWAGIIGLVVSITATALWNTGVTNGITAMLLILLIVPAFVVPLAVVVFFWEMDMTGQSSLLEVLLLVLIGGILSLTTTGLFSIFVPLPFSTEAYIAGPLPEETAKFAVVFLLLCRKKMRFGVQGILVGGSVGAGFAAFESASYALRSFMSQLQTVAAENAYQGMIEAMYGDGGVSLALATQEMTENIIVRGALSIGGHVLWAALYGGALGLLRYKGKMSGKYLVDPLVLATFFGAVLLHTFWNLSGYAFLGILPDSVVLFLLKLDAYYVKYIMLIVFGWLLLLFIMRKCIRQMIAADAFYHMSAAPALQPEVHAHHRGHGYEQAHVQAQGRVILTVTASGKLNTGKRYELHSGDSLIFGRDRHKANVAFPPDTKGISSVHCEIKVKDGVPVLIDRNSTYGTFFSNGTKLEPNVPYKIKGHVKFYLAGKDNQFDIRLQ